MTDNIAHLTATERTYVKNGRIAWSEGYKPYRMRALKGMVADPHILEIFDRGSVLPSGFGRGLDERLVEYPWVLSQLQGDNNPLLDAGSTLNYPYLLDLPQLSSLTIVILTLAPEWQDKRPNVSYMYGDLRNTLLRSEAFRTLVCISTLEHIGMDNTMLYTSEPAYRESSSDDYLKAIGEFRRLLAPGGKLLLTVPYGRRANLGWMQQFDARMLRAVSEAFARPPDRTDFFRYTQDGWAASDAAACADSEYFDVHAAAAPAPDGAAAARAVACMAFTA